jgi:DNA-directed RNA polymerase subunit RPC12/RpoP
MITKRYMQAYMLLAAIGLFGVLVTLYSTRNPRLEALVVGVAVALIMPLPLIWLLQKLGYPVGKTVNCARCGSELPAVRRPANARQALLGGYTCGKCGAELDARGRERAPS